MPSFVHKSAWPTLIQLMYSGSWNLSNGAIVLTTVASTEIYRRLVKDDLRNALFESDVALYHIDRIRLVSTSTGRSFLLKQSETNVTKF